MIRPDKILDHVRNNPEGLARIRLGRGVVGNTTYAFISVVAAVAVVAFFFKGNLTVGAWIIGALLLVFVIYFLGIFWFAHKHPNVAMLGDAEYLQLMESKMAAAGLRTLPKGEIIEDPNPSHFLGRDDNDA